MYLYAAAQLRAWDAFTIAKEPITSVELMERAAVAVADWLLYNMPANSQYVICCGRGNNGGDGLAVARFLLKYCGCEVSVWVTEGARFSDDTAIVYGKLIAEGVLINALTPEAALPVDPSKTVIIDALLGTGLSRPPEGIMADIIFKINAATCTRVSIDVPSGLPVDNLNRGNAVVQAHHTLSFEAPKLSFLLPEHEVFVGKWVVLPIGLHPGFMQLERSPWQYVDEAFARTLLPPQRPVHTYKNKWGHVLILGGSPAMSGAALMAAAACLRSGAGLLTVGLPQQACAALNAKCPEAMIAPAETWMQHSLYNDKTAVVAGMGWQADDYHGRLLLWLINNVSCPLVLDATALQLLAQQPNWLKHRPAGAFTLLTPHPGEFRRLAGPAQNSVEQLEKAKTFASEYNVMILLKGAYTRLITPGGLVYFNSTGNPGMAQGGMGDALAGLITGLLAQPLPPVAATLLGTWLHGLAGNMAAAAFTMPGMTTTNLIESIPLAWKQLYNEQNGQKDY
ncbi:MAG: NAD(P)H-hydrate dehydratase [Chitinophagaceae bacterium]|nr:NAD(P)H-hydrate dehydratase [Chitinophagaceae bacterium]